MERQQPKKFDDVKPGDWKFFKNKDDLEKYVKEHFPNRKLSQDKMGDKK